MAVPLVEPGELEPDAGPCDVIGQRISERVQVVLLFGLVADEGGAAEDRAPSLAAASSPRS